MTKRTIAYQLLGLYVVCSALYTTAQIGKLIGFPRGLITLAIFVAFWFAGNFVEAALRHLNAQR